MGNRAIILILIDDYHADLGQISVNGISPSHFAAQNYNGYLSLLLLKYNFQQFDANCRSALQATPLHFAVINRQFKNVELLISLRADVNAIDKEGRTPLHIAIIRLCALFSNKDFDQTFSDAESKYDIIFKEYKAIIKELLFNGANRLIKTNEDKTAFNIYEEYKDHFTEQQ